MLEWRSINPRHAMQEMGQHPYAFQPTEESGDGKERPAVLKEGRDWVLKDAGNAADVPQGGSDVPSHGASGGATPDATAPVIDFKPQLQHRHEGKHLSPWSKLRANFNLDVFWSFYPMLRAFGYGWQAIYSPINRYLTGGYDKAIRGEQTHWIGKALHKHYRNDPPKKGDETDFGKHISRVESVMFTGLAFAHGVQQDKKLHKDCDLAVAAELGKEQKDISLYDLRMCNNPLIVSMVDRTLWQQFWRHAAGLSFLANVNVGIGVNALLITQERTIFYRPIAFDILQKTVNDVQLNNLGAETKADLVNNLIRVLQAVQLDHRRDLIPSDHIQALKPLLEDIAQDVIDKRFGFQGMLYIMGGGVIIPGNPEQSMRNYQHVRQIGVSGVADEARTLRILRKVPSTKIWDAQVDPRDRAVQNEEAILRNAVGSAVAREAKARRKGDYVAESARPEALVRQRQEIIDKGPRHISIADGAVTAGDPRGAVQVM